MNSIILEGQITNKVIPGANGDFSVGSFNTPVGQFKIKNQLLDQFDEGDYQVRVSITKLKLNTYVVQRTGITITEIVAEIDAIDVIDADVKPIKTESIEPDASVAPEQAQPEPKPVKPVKEDKPVKAPSGKTGGDQGKAVPSSKTSEPVPATDDKKPLDPSELFGYLWPLKDTFQLDTTIPRQLIIQQKQYLVQAGYKFDARSQTWSK